jgi:hypothetical protein
MLDLFDFPKNQIISSLALPITASKSTRFLLLPNKIILIHEGSWISIDQQTGLVIDTFITKTYPLKGVCYSLGLGIFAILKNEPLAPITSSSFKTRIAKLSPIDGSVESFLEVLGFEEGESLLDLCADDKSIFFLTTKANKKRIKQYSFSTKQLLLLTDNLNNTTPYDRLKISGDTLLLLDSLENALYEINKISGRSIASKREFLNGAQVVDFNIKFNNLFIILERSNKFYQVSLSSEWAHVALQTNVYELATNGANQSLIRGSVFNEDETFLPSSPLEVRILKPINLLQQYIDKNIINLSATNSTGNAFLPLLEKTNTSLLMHPGSQWEFLPANPLDIEQIRLRFESFRPGDIEIQLLINNIWTILEDLPLPLLLTKADLVFDNFLGLTKVSCSGFKIINTTSNTIALRKVSLLELDPNSSQNTITNYASDTGQTLFFIASPQTTINEVVNPRFLESKLSWDFFGRSEIVNETLATGDIGAFLHSLGDDKVTQISQNIVLNQPQARIITASAFIKANIVFTNPLETNCGLEITIRDVDGNSQTYYQSFIQGSYNYKRFYKTIVPLFPIYDLDFKIICRKDTKGSIEVDKAQLEQDLLHDFIDYQEPNIFVKAVYKF